jgi:hypothetical protein
MGEYYDRRFQLDLDEKPLILETGGRQFRVVFNILHDFGGFISYADISIYGISRGTEGKAFKRGQKIDFKAGYADSLDYIFRGEVVNLFREKRGADRLVRLICMGGAVNRQDTSIALTLGKNTSLVDIIKPLSAAIGYPLVIKKEDFEGINYGRGYAMNGSPTDYLKKLAKTHKFNWVIENNRLIVVKSESYRDGSVHQISQFTGMVGAPEITEVGADVDLKLSPKIKIGGRFQITSEYKTFNFSDVYFKGIKESQGLGVYRIFKIEHSGDSYGDNWNSKITGLV